MAQQLEIKDGDVIWMSVGSGFPKWPCKVCEIIDDKNANVESFGDNVPYTNKKISTFTKFTEDKGTLVTSGRKKLKSKRQDLHLFESAIKEAVDYIHADIDPNFQLQELDASFNVSLASLDSSMDISDTSISIEHTPSITNSSRKRTRKSAQLSAKKYRSASQTSESTPLDTCTLDNMDANTLTPYRKQSLRDQSPSDLKSSPQQSFSEGEVSVTMDCLLKTPTSESLNHNNQPSTELSDSSPQCNISSIPLNTSPCLETETCSTYQSETSDYKTDASQETKVSDYQPDTSDHEAKISVPESETLNVHTETSVDETNVISKSLDEPTTLESTANSASVSPVPNIPDENESESDDDLPQVDFSGQNWTSASIKRNDIIWAKYKRDPYWPALVHSIKKKRVQVFFLGWPDEDAKVRFNYNKSKKNMLAFNYQNTEKFKHESSEQLDKLKRDAFNLALNEADQLLLRRESKDIDGPPELQYKLICQRRPLNFFENFFPSKPTRTLTPSSDNKPNMSAFGYDISSAQKELWGDSEDDDQSDVSGDWDDDENETEDTSLPYCFTHIKEQFEQFKPELEKICRGEIYSELHQIYTTGLSKERGAMKYQEKYGPADHLSDKKKMELFYFLQDIAEKVFDGQRNFTYVYDVLLPEAMARTISAIDECSLEDAWKKLQSKIN